MRVRAVAVEQLKPRPSSIASHAGRLAKRELTSAISRSARLQHAARLAQKVDVVRAHQREAKDGDVERAVGQRSRAMSHAVTRSLLATRSNEWTRCGTLRASSASPQPRSPTTHVPLRAQPARHEVHRVDGPARGLQPEALVVRVGEPGSRSKSASDSAEPCVYSSSLMCRNRAPAAARVPRRRPTFRWRRRCWRRRRLGGRLFALAACASSTAARPRAAALLAAAEGGALGAEESGEVRHSSASRCAEFHTVASPL